jgi:GT2 family glycosyltransferase
MAAAGVGEGPRVGIVTLNFNAYEDTSRCLRSLLGLAHEPKDIIVVDNGSWDGSCERLAADFPSIHVLRSDRNLGYGGGVNMGFEKALGMGCEYLVCFNNDGLVDDREFLQKLLGQFQSDPKTGVAGAVELDIAGEKVVQSGASRDGRFEMKASGAAFMVSKGALEGAGMFDPGFFLGYEDVDLFDRIEMSGLKVTTVPEARFRHARLSSRKKYPLLSTYLEARNRTILMARQGDIIRFAKGVLWLHAKRMPRYALAFSENDRPEMFLAYVRGLLRGIALLPRSRRPGDLPAFDPSRWMVPGELPLDL